MKNILAVLFFLIALSKNSNGQIDPVAGAYYTNNTMGTFVGTWQYANVYDTIIIKLKVKKVYIPINGGFYWDKLVGWHMYKRGLVIVENSLPYFDDVSKITITHGSNTPENLNNISGFANDPRKNKSGQLSLTLLSNVTPNQLVWKLENTEGVRVRTNPNQAPYDWGFTLPENMVLIKQ